MQDLGKVLLILGLVLALAGVVLILLNRIPWLGHLPGDISIQSSNWSCFFPIVTSLILSIILTIVLNVILALMRR